MKMKPVLFAVAVVAAAAFWIFNPARTAEVETVLPSRGPAVQAVYATGTVEAAVMIPISPKIAARLLALEADEGSRVEAGQTLAQLEDADIRENLTELEVRLDLAGKDLRRAQTLAKSGALSKESLDTAQATFKTAEASVQRSRAELGYLKLLAPENGTIIRRDGEIGELITVGTPVFWMSGGDRLRIETEVDEEDIGLVQPGQKVIIRADAFPDKVFEGSVQSITPKGDPVARSYRVRVSMADDTPLMIGMTAETNIITKEKKDALLVPATAVKGDSVYVMKGNTPVLTKIRKGIVAEKSVEILEGIAEGSRLALRYNDILQDEDARDKAVCNMGTGC